MQNFLYLEIFNNVMITYYELVEMIEDQRKPFTEECYDGYIIRHFDPSYPEHLFKWHWDEDDRWVESLYETDWKFQFDNEIPQLLEVNKIIFIPKGIYHRLIPGSKKLSIKIKINN